MKIIIFDHLGCHASVLAGSYLRGVISLKSSTRDILAIPCFGFYDSLSPGSSFYLGQDQKDNKIYTLGVGPEAKAMIISTHDLLKILDIKDDLKIIDVSAYNTPLVRFFLYLGLLKPFSKIARYFCASVLRTCLPELSLLLKQESE